jgi:hypothetical protein
MEKVNSTVEVPSSSVRLFYKERYIVRLPRVYLEKNAKEMPSIR